MSSVSGQPADEEEPTASGGELPSYYETATVRARPLSSATAAVTVLQREDIEAFNALTVTELIRFIPGLDATSSGSRGGVAFAQIQGGEPNFTVVLLDGVPLNDTTDQLGGAVNLNSLSTSQIERIEVVRGPLSSFFGSAGLSGVINIITRKGDTDRPAVDVRAAVGDADVARAAASVSRGNEQRDFFVGLTWEKEEERVADDSFEQLSLKGNYRTSLGGDSSLRIAGRVTSWEAKNYAESSGGVLGNGEKENSDNDEFSLGLELLIGRKDRHHKVYVGVLRHDLDRSSPEIVSPDVIPASMETTRFLHWISGWAYPVIGSERTKLRLGVEVDYRDGDSDSTLFTSFGPLPTSYEIDRATGAGLLELVAQRGRFVIEVGARVDVPEGFGTQFNPRAGLTYRLSGDKTRLRISAGRAFKLPSLFALGNPVVGNPDLQPELTLGGDVGVEHRFASARVTTTFSLFYYDYEDLIDFVADPFPTLVNRSQVGARGAQLAVRWQATDGIALSVNLSHQNVEDADTGETLVHRPDWYGGARFNWQVTKRLRWQVDGQFATDQRDIQVAVPTRDTVPQYELFGTALLYDLGNHWGIDARINNLLDEEYETAVGFPGPERSFRVGARFHTR